MRATLLAIAVLTALAALPSSASAATCSLLRLQLGVIGA